jgi:hypothetical protein
MHQKLDAPALDILFRTATTRNAWSPEPVGPGTPIRSNFICSLGCGTDEKLLPRNPRLVLDEAGRFACGGYSS